jgi:hypothetical protein
MPNYNTNTETAEKLAVRVNSKGGASIWGVAGTYTLKPPTSVSLGTAHTGTAGIVAGTYNFIVTRVTNGVESFGAFLSNVVIASNCDYVIINTEDITTSTAEPTPATSFHLYAGKNGDDVTLQASVAISNAIALRWVAYTTSGVSYTDSPAVVAYPEASGPGAYQSVTWVTDAVLHNPNESNGYSGYPEYGQLNQVRQVRTNIIESQIYSRTDSVDNTSGQSEIYDASITWSDFGKPVTGVGIPPNSFVGEVTNAFGYQGSNPYFVLSSVQRETVPVATTENVASITVTGSNVGPIPVQTGQYRTRTWQG